MAFFIKQLSDLAWAGGLRNIQAILSYLLSTMAIPNLTDDEFRRALDTSNPLEWNDFCDEVKAARGGEYPPDWFERMLVSGVMATIFKNYP